MVGAAGANLAVGDPLHDAAPPDTVARQDPAPSTQIQPGSLITVSLSLGPEPAPTNPPQVAPPEPPQVQPKPQPPGKGKKDKKGQNDDGD
jgi:beta-lactam-binding protein with PASTA domain